MTDKQKDICNKIRALIDTEDSKAKIAILYKIKDAYLDECEE